MIYLEGEADHPPNVREAWVRAKEFWRFVTPGAPGTIVQLLKQDLGVTGAVGAFQTGDVEGESVYVLTRDSSDPGKADPGKTDPWRVAKAYVQGERAFTSTGEIQKFLEDESIPLVVVDFNQGWAPHGSDSGTGRGVAKKRLAKLRNRPFLIRTHDPRLPLWEQLRRSRTRSEDGDGHTRIWFSPIQDVAHGALRFPGTWEDLRDVVFNYFRRDETLVREGCWRDHVIVQVHEDGVLWLEAGSEAEAAENVHVFAFPSHQPGSFSWKGLGTVVGGGVILVASLARALASEFEPKVEIKKAIQAGLIGIHRFFQSGYLPPRPLPGKPADVVSKQEQTIKGEKRWETRILPTTIFRARPPARRGKGREERPIPYKRADEKSWKVAVDLIGRPGSRIGQLLALRLGEYAVADHDYARKLLELSAQLQAFRERWRRDPAKAGVLSFALYGGPGSGKSFLARQLARAVDPRKEAFEDIEQNLSQFDGPQRLSEALEEVRNCGLRGRLPIVLWDEFDTSFEGALRGGWLGRFLMPMQDAAFQDNGERRKLGSAVFAFIGGTFSDDSDFRDWMDREEGIQAKAPDFHSRLAASIEAPSIAVDRDAIEPGRAGRYLGGPGRLNRALLLRHYLRKRPKGWHQLSSVDEDVLGLLLHLPLTHGARSLEKLVASSALRGTERFQVQHLPPPSVLNLHVKGLQSARIEGRKLTGRTLARMLIEELGIAPFINEGKKLELRRDKPEDRSS